MANLLQWAACVLQWGQLGFLSEGLHAQTVTPCSSRTDQSVNTRPLLKWECSVLLELLFVSRPRKDGDTCLARAQPAEQTVPRKADPFAWPPASWPWTRPNLFHFSPAILILLQKRITHITQHSRISVFSIQVSPWSFQNISYHGGWIGTYENTVIKSILLYNL